MWTAWSKKKFCNGKLGPSLSSKSWILDIKHAISTIKMQIWNQFFPKKIHYIVVISLISFHQPARSSSFFLVFCLQFYGRTFYGWPYITTYSYPVMQNEDISWCRVNKGFCGDFWDHRDCLKQSSLLFWKCNNFFFFLIYWWRTTLPLFWQLSYSKL